MKELTKAIIIPSGSSERLINLPDLCNGEYFSGNVFMSAICSYTPGYHIRYPEAKRHDVLCCLEGAFEYTYNEFSGVLNPGEILVMPAGGYQEFSSSIPSRSMFFLLTPDSVWGELLFRHEKMINPELFPLLMEKAASMDPEHEERKNMAPALGKMIFLLLKEELHQSENANTIFQRLKNRLQLYPQKNWTVEIMAEECGVSVPHFFFLCRKYFQCPPYQLLKKFRMDLAEELLLSTSYPIKLISNMCGYEHPFAFTRSFRNHTGISPAAFRKKHAGN